MEVVGNKGCIDVEQLGICEVIRQDVGHRLFAGVSKFIMKHGEPSFNAALDRKLYSPNGWRVVNSFFVFLGELDEVIYKSSACPCLANVGFVFGFTYLLTLAIEFGTDLGFWRTPRNGVPKSTIPHIFAVSTDVALIDFGVTAFHEAMEKLLGVITAVELLEVEGYIDTADSSKLETVLVDEFLQHLGTAFEVACAVAKTDGYAVGLEVLRC